MNSKHSWKKYRIKTTADATDFISAILIDLGITGIEIEDNIPLSQEEKEELYIDFLPKLKEDDPTAFISFYLEENEAEEELLKQIHVLMQELSDTVDIGAGSIEKSLTNEDDWINNWKEFFKSFFIEDILIKPTWEAEPNIKEYKYKIEIDPKTSFGTGKHETTKLCIIQLRKYLKTDHQVLDVGCGSGILSIVSFMLGAKSVTGIDVDTLCMDATRENIMLNDLSHKEMKLIHGNLLTDHTLVNTIGFHSYDIILANILADVIIPITDIVKDCLKSGGLYITSGIIDFKENEVKESIVKAGLVILEITRLGEWVSITAKKE